MGDSLTESRFGNYTLHLQKFFIKNIINAKVISLGRPGNTSGEYLRYLESKTPIKKLNPDIVILMLGTNDVRIDGDNTPTNIYKKNMKKIIGIIRNTDNNNPDPVKIFIMTIPPIFVTDLNTFSTESVKRVENEIVPAIREMSEKEKLKLIDINSFFHRNKDLLPGIHPSPAGYFMMAKFIFNQLKKDLKFNI